MVRSAEAQASLRSLRMLGCDPRVSNHEARSVAAHPSRRRAPRGPQDEADQQRAAIVKNNESTMEFLHKGSFFSVLARSARANNNG
jgi:hypothetical protein